MNLRQNRMRPLAARAPTWATFACSLGALALYVATAAVGHAQSGPIENLSTFPRATLEIHTRTGTHRFDVWVADTPNRQTQGLMFVRDLPANEGMLFTKCCSGIWMKNTYISLDIVFVGPHHRVIKIAKRARPFDLSTISAPPPVDEVIELKGGEAAALDLRVGDRIDWQMSRSASHPKS